MEMGSRFVRRAGLLQDGRLGDGLHGRQITGGFRAGTIRKVNGEQGCKDDGEADADVGLGAADEAEGAGIRGGGHGFGGGGWGQERGREAPRPEARNTTLAEEGARVLRDVGDVNTLGDAFTGEGVFHRR